MNNQWFGCWVLMISDIVVRTLLSEVFMKIQFRKPFTGLKLDVV